MPELKTSRRSILTLFGMAPALKIPIKPIVRPLSADDRRRIIKTIEDFKDIIWGPEMSPVTDRDWKIPFRFSDNPAVKEFLSEERGRIS
jgi:hypothetical protein